MSRRKAHQDLQSYFDSLLQEEAVSSSSVKIETSASEQSLKQEEPEHGSPAIAAPAEPNVSEEKTNIPLSEKPISRSLKSESTPPYEKTPSTSISNYASTPSPKRRDYAELDQREALPFDEVSLQQEKKQELQKLLSQSTFFAKAEAVVEPAVKVEVPVEQKLNPMPEVELEEQEDSDIDDPDAVVDLDTYDSFHVDQNALIEWAENGRPVWAQEKFEVLLFEVSGLTLAVPLISLGQIFPVSEELTPIFGQAEWMMGLMPTALGKLRIVNTALFVMPEKYDTEFTKNAKYVVSIDGVPWALAVDRVNQPISLDPSDIRWRGERSKRPWLAGTVKSAMCALLDIPQMSKLLSNTDKSLRQ